VTLSKMCRVKWERGHAIWSSMMGRQGLELAGYRRNKTERRDVIVFN